MKNPVSKSQYMIGIMIGVSFVSGVMFCFLQNEKEIFSRYLHFRFKQNKTSQPVKDPITTIRQVQ